MPDYHLAEWPHSACGAVTLKSSTCLLQPIAEWRRSRLVNRFECVTVRSRFTRPFGLSPKRKHHVSSCDATVTIHAHLP